MVVRVVVMERSDGAGDENVLLRSPSVRAAVPLVPTPDGATSECVVSAVVARVGARDLGWPWLDLDGDNDRLLCDVELGRDSMGSAASDE
jgi:hypothetical protein